MAEQAQTKVREEVVQRPLEELGSVTLIFGDNSYKTQNHAVHTAVEMGLKARGGLLSHSFSASYAGHGALGLEFATPDPGLVRRCAETGILGRDVICRSTREQQSLTLDLQRQTERSPMKTVPFKPLPPEVL